MRKSIQVFHMIYLTGGNNMEVKHIGIFGKRNVGKSSLVNTLLGENVAIVSPEAGTTTDPVKKRMEIFGVGPVQLIDTAGLDDRGELGGLRVKKTRAVFSQIDLAFVLFAGNMFGKEEREICKQLHAFGVPVVLVHNQSDIIPLDPGIAFELTEKFGCDVVEFSCCMLDEREQQQAVDMLVSFIVKNISDSEKSILHALVQAGDTVALVCPVDEGAPTGRLILPQVMAVRDVLDHDAVAVVLQPERLEGYLKKSTPSLVVTDSQAFREVAALTPENIPVTSFSVLLARSKGNFKEYVSGTGAISGLKKGDKVLVLESCTHHKSCDDIGRVKIPGMLCKFIGEQPGALEFTFVSGLDEIPGGAYALAIQCGGCMVTSKQLNNRIKELIKRGVKVTNYGMAIAYMNGIFARAVAGAGWRG